MQSDEELQMEIKEIVLERMDLTKDIKDEEVLNIIDDVIIEKGKRTFIQVQIKNRLRYMVFNAIRRLDLLQELIDDKDITEIMVNGPENIFIEKNGKLTKWDKHFDSKEKYEDIIQQIVSRANRAVNEANPIVDARLMDGSRVNVVMEPIAIDGTTLTIRKFPEHPMTVEQLLLYKSINQEVAHLLEQLVIAKYNIFISGGTGSGKTTFLNALSNFIPCDERIITIEDSAELQIRNIPNLVRLEVRNSNVEGKNGISIRDLIKSSLRMRPDRIIVGEVRDGAAIDMLTALNTGHDGSLSTGHANSPRDMLSRLETLVLLNSEIPLLAVRKQIASAIDIIVHLGRLRDKSRHVLEIVEVLDCVDNEIKINPLYEFKEKGVDAEGRIEGELVRTDYRLNNTEKLSRAGVRIYD
ncbi:type II/IV secretion system ATP hydrolase TadA/VirB11/CpaF, TadA subfamily [Lachnospiraceae bacterium KM106-2]|nr:type II/IV secretion system ATP hydrolase TadA/VirB11/CpaF, TadA subfamily [Lachnospiraceae bacterium KM106-2]